MGNTNNQLGGRTTVAQAGGYGLIVYDTGNRNSVFSGLLMPDGSDLNFTKIDQAGWFSSWLAEARFSEFGFGTLWMLGSNLLENSPTASVFTEMGVLLNKEDQGLNVNPTVDGVATFAFDQGSGTAVVDFSADSFVLNGGCPSIETYDGLVATSPAIATHLYRSLTAVGDAALVMNTHSGQNWNTIFQSHAWSDIRDPDAVPAAKPEEALMRKVLDNALPVACRQQPNPVDVGDSDELEGPRETVLRANVPNPFNPITTIIFDLATPGRVALRIYDTRGRLLRTLLDEDMSPARNYRVVWDGMDRDGKPVSSGIYLCRLDAGGISTTRKLVAVR